MIRPGASSSTAARRFVFALLLLAGGEAALAVSPPPGAAAGVEAGSVAPLVDRVKASVVTIQSTKFIRRFAMEDPWSRMLREQFGFPAPKPSREKQEGLGSGFIVDKTGIILTNNHVVAGADEVVVKLADNRRFAAKVLGSDPPTDVAVIRLDKPPGDLQPAALGDSDRVRVGDYVLAIGNPLGLGQTVTMGIVSAKNRVIGERLGDVDPRYEDFIQTDAAINQGNSGGPLFNFKGEVIGINAAIINPGVAMNVGFAIPINLARRIADQIRSAGRVARGYLGVSGEDFTPERAAELRVPFVPGALINTVGRGTPAAAAGIAPNDVITEVSGRPIDGQRRLTATIALLRPGEKVKLGLVRGGRRMEVTVTVGAPETAGGGVAAALGVSVRPLDVREAGALGLAPGNGLAVVGVDPRGPASGAIEEGDVLLALDGKPITLARFKALESRLAQGDRATLVIQRGPDRFALRL
jgi:serine protease Do